MVAVAALVLAAGSGRRYAAAGGIGPKVLATLDGRPLISLVLDVAAAAGLDPVLVVVAPESDGILPVTAAHPSTRTVVNPDAAAGMATSVAAGLDALRSSDDEVLACVVLLADQPSVDPSVIAQVIAAWRRTGDPARARYADGLGHPVLLPRGTWETVVQHLRAPGSVDLGARHLLGALGANEVAVPGPMPTDVDVPDDLGRAGDRG